MKSLHLTGVLLVALSFSAPTRAETAAIALPRFEQVRTEYIPSDALLLDRHGEPLADLRLNPSVRRLNWVPITSLPATMREALLVAEDRRFFEHSGVDWKAIAGAAWQNLWNKSKRGASTLTMQLAGLLEPQLKLPSQTAGGRRNLTQKWDQSVAALELERQWSKEQILEAYLNLAPFRGDLQGIESASQVLFGLPSSALTRKEAVILAVLLRGPNAPVERVSRRACVLAQTLGSGRLCNDITILTKARLDLPRNVPRYAAAPHLARLLLRHPGQRQMSTLEGSWQREAEQIVQHLDGQGSVLIIDNTTGEILVWVGAANGAQADGITARTSQMNWWWPYAAELTLERRMLNPATLIIDPISQEENPYDPAMYSLRMTLSQHLSGPMQLVLSGLGQDVLGERLHALGLDVPANTITAGQSGDTSLLQLAGAWRTLAYNGLYLTLHAVPTDPIIPRKVMPSDATYLTLDILNTQRYPEWEPQWQSTSSDGYQSMQLGSTEHYTIAVGVTANIVDEAPHMAQQLWHDIARATHIQPDHRPRPPGTLTTDLVVFEPPVEAPRRDWFFRGTDKENWLRYYPENP